MSAILLLHHLSERREEMKLWFDVNHHSGQATHAESWLLIVRYLDQDFDTFFFGRLCRLTSRCSDWPESTNEWSMTHSFSTFHSLVEVFVIDARFACFSIFTTRHLQHTTNQKWYSVIDEFELRWKLPNDRMIWFHWLGESHPRDSKKIVFAWRKSLVRTTVTNFARKTCWSRAKKTTNHKRSVQSAHLPTSFLLQTIGTMKKILCQNTRVTSQDTFPQFFVGNML